MSRSSFSRTLEPLVASLWGFFLVWTLLLVAVWVGGVDAPWLKEKVANEGVRSALIALVNSVVTVWLALGVVNIHLALARAEGLSTARRWLGWLLGGALALGLLAYFVGAPARVHFLHSLGAHGEWQRSGVLGPFFFGVPIGWILLWVLLVAGAREFILWLRPRASHTVTALTGAALVLLSLLNLEPLAGGGRWQWWFWYQGDLRTAAPAPWAAYALLALGASWMLRQTELIERLPRRSRKPALAFLLFNALLFAAHLRLWLAPPEVFNVEMP